MLYKFLTLFLCLHLELFSNPLCSLVYHMDRELSAAKFYAGLIEKKKERIHMTKEEVLSLFEKSREDLNEAKIAWQEGVCFLNSGDFVNAVTCLNFAKENLFHKWVASFEYPPIQQEALDQIESLDISQEQKERISRFILPLDHECFLAMSRLFDAELHTENLQSLEASHFTIFSYQPRSFIVLATHPELLGYFLKINLECDTRIKEGFASYEWFTRRCENKALLENTIKKHHIKHFILANKWLYPNRHSHVHKFLLLAEKMDILDEKTSLEAWKAMNEEQLYELYTLFANAYAGSWRPDNIVITPSGQFAFVDTEHKGCVPIFERILRYINPKHHPFWINLVKSGGLTFANVP